MRNIIKELLINEFFQTKDWKNSTLPGDEPLIVVECSKIFLSAVQDCIRQELENSKSMVISNPSLPDNEADWAKMRFTTFVIPSLVKFEFKEIEGITGFRFANVGQAQKLWD